MMKLTVNGDPMELSEGTTVTSLLEQVKLKPELVVVELNLSILKRDELPKTVLKTGDQVEIVHFVGGGAEETPEPAPAPPAGEEPKPKPKAKRKSKKVTMKSGALVIVESPTKAKTLGRFLGSGYKVIASLGHVMDLPSSQFGVDLENNFTPKYIVIFKKRKIVKELKLEAAPYKTLYLATDPDREGEAISAHLATVLGKDKVVKRAVFHEITPEAVKHAFDHPREVEVHKVEAQQARRILDRILGYSLSPLLWKKVGSGLSAGRVQSVALKLIVDREREIRAFTPQEYWQIEAELAKQKPAAGEPASFTAGLETVDGKKAEMTNGEQANGLLKEIEGKPFEVSKVTTRQTQRHPSPPFTTSTLQQDAFNKIGFTAGRTMRIAQQLYEGIELGSEGPVGLITYMRTDSVQVAAEATAQAKSFIEKQFGKEFLPDAPRKYKSKKGAQEAHEAIRPTSASRTPEAVRSSLTPEQFKLYTLIWNRFLASQMASARMEVTTVDIAVGRCGFRASGTRVVFAGFLQIFRGEEAAAKKRKAAETPEQEKEESEEKTESQPLPALEKGEKLKALKIDPSQHFTKPPPRYTEASLVRTMEELGIGRPSTYAPTIMTVTNRGYVHRLGRAIIPTELGETVTDLLSQHFPRVLEVNFTANVEEALDLVEEGKQPWTECVREFYGPFAEALKTAAAEMQDMKQNPVPTDENCPQCGKVIVIKWGRNGKFLSCSGFPDCKFAKPITTGVKCPEAGCEGELVQRRSRRGPFFGCSKFPACRHISRNLPQPPPQEGPDAQAAAGS